MERIDINRIIEMAYWDRIPFEAITIQFGLIVNDGNSLLI